MNNKTILGISAVVLAALAAGMLWYGETIIAARRRSLAALDAERTKAAGESRRLADHGAAVERDAAALRADLAKSKPSAPAGEKTPTRTAAAMDPRTLEREALANDPQLQVRWLAAARFRLDRAYGPFLQMRGLSPAQIEQFQAALIKREEMGFDLAGAARTQGPESDAAIAKLRQDAEREAKVAIEAVLGADGVAALKEYDRTAETRMIVSQVAAAAQFEGAALTPAQSEQLVQVLAASSPDYASGGKANPTKMDLVEAQRRAKEILTPAQADLLRRGLVEIGLDAAIAKARQRAAEAKSAVGGG